MKLSAEQRRTVHRKTNGKCHICGSRRAFNAYGLSDVEGGWHLDHSQPRAKGGTDHLNNLFVACAGCNCSKGKRHNSNGARSAWTQSCAAQSEAKERPKNR